MTAEHRRLEDNRIGTAAWLAWGPYLSERQWGTVREDYSAGGDAWDYFPHDQARSRAYRWGEDGIAGICDDRQRLCFALALWNGVDPILKERMFGLTNGEGNHGEDVKEYYFYLDSTPTHSYLKTLYKYPQREFPYNDLVATNGRRGRDEFEYELIDTGIFAEDRYFDVFVEYAKAAPDDILVEITVAQPRPRPGHAAPAADAVVSQHLGVVDPAASRPRSSAPAPTRCGSQHPRARRVGALLRGAPRSCCSARTRRTTRGCSAHRTSPRTSRTASTTTWSAASTARSTRRAGAPRSAALHELDARAGRERPRARAADGGLGARQRARSAPASTAC